MIAQVRGEVIDRDATSVVVDVGGIGYLVHVTPGDRVPPRGQPVVLHTSLQVREDSLTLYGFTQRPSLVLFELLISSSGVGPKLAMAALGTHQPDVLRVAIAGSDFSTLTQIPGVGKKVAQRLVLELKDRVGALAPAIADAEDGAGAPTDVSVTGEVRDALLALGYSASEVRAALVHTRVEGDADTAQLLRAALRALGSGTLEEIGR